MISESGKTKSGEELQTLVKSRISFMAYHFQRTGLDFLQVTKAPDAKVTKNCTSKFMQQKSYKRFCVRGTNSAPTTGIGLSTRYDDICLT